MRALIGALVLSSIFALPARPATAQDAEALRPLDVETVATTS